jgi:hypothetical protein
MGSGQKWNHLAAQNGRALSGRNPGWSRYGELLQAAQADHSANGLTATDS